ncbi:MAG TPA: hypothetical protein VGF48_20315 [Thermoanaerobaculia bacterium]
MRRFAFAFCLLTVVPAVAYAFEPEPRIVEERIDDGRTDSRNARIGLLRMPNSGTVGEQIVNHIRRELRDAGYDAYTVPATYEEVRDGMGADADFYVEVVSEGSTTPHGGIDVGGRNVGVSIEVVVSRFTGELRVYHGRSLQLLGSRELHERASGVMPTYIGLGGRNGHLGVALPFARWTQNRRVVRGAAREAAAAVVATVRGE